MQAFSVCRKCYRPFCLHLPALYYVSSAIGDDVLAHLERLEAHNTTEVRHSKA